MTTNYVRTYLDGKDHSVKYWADGDGMDYYDYCTSFDKLHAQLCKHYAVKALDMFILIEGGKPKQLKNDDDMKDALQSLDDLDSIAVTLFQRKTKKKKKGKKKIEESDDETSDDSDDSGTKMYQSKKNGKNKQQANKKGGKGGKSEKELQAIVSHFALNGRDCYYCHGEIPGVTYEWSADIDFTICRECFNKRPKQEKYGWEQCRPFEEDAPEAPLSIYDEWPQSNAVRHLQFLYTVMGLMDVEDTSEYQGSYQTYTAAATEKFRKFHKIKGDDLSVYDEKTAKKMAEIVREMRKKGHKYV